MKPRLYDHKWRSYRAKYLKRHSLCVMCQEEGRRTIATVIDHKTPHKGDLSLFWDERNHQPLCKLHHDSVKAREEYNGKRVNPVGLDGWPIKPDQ